MEGNGMDVCPPPPRLTRSRVAPAWTPQEMLALANEVAAVEADCGRALSAYQRWKIITDNCNSILGGAPRGANLCRRQWDTMVADYRRIQAWEDGNKPSYWSLEIGGRRGAHLPAAFDREVFRAIARSQERGSKDENAVVIGSENREDHHETKDDDAVSVVEVSASGPAAETKRSKTAKGPKVMLHELRDRENAPHEGFNEEQQKVSSKPAMETTDKKASITKSRKAAPDLPCNLEESAQDVGSRKVVPARLSKRAKLMLDMACEPQDNAQEGSSKKAVQSKSGKTTQRLQDMSCELGASAQHVHAILKGEPCKDDAGEVPARVDLNKPSSAHVEVTRCQADRLIKALASLISNVEHFTKLADEHEGETYVG